MMVHRSFKEFKELARAVVPTIEDYMDLVEVHDHEVEEKATELADEKAANLFNEKIEEHRLQVIKEIDEANTKAKYAEISTSSPYISTRDSVNNKDVCGIDYIDRYYLKAPEYDEAQLIYNEYTHDYQLLYRNGKRKYVSNFVVVACVVVNESGPGRCRAIVVYLRDSEIPIIFPYGEINSSELRRQAWFKMKGLNVGYDIYFASFVAALRKCQNILFLTIPKHPGMNILPSGDYDYTSALSVIPGLEKLYPKEIKSHYLIQHDKKFMDVVTEYQNRIPDSWRCKASVAVRITSLLLPFFASERLSPDRIIVFTPKNNAEKELFISLTKRENYTTSVTNSLSDRLNKVKAMLSAGNDMTVIFTYLEGIDDLHSFNNGLTEIRMDLTGENGIEDPTRKVIVLVTDVPGLVPEEYPALYLSFAEEIHDCNARELQRLSGEFDYSLIQYLIHNPDHSKKLISEAITEAEALLNCNTDEQPDLAIMITAAVFLLAKIDLVSLDEVQMIGKWLHSEATSRTTVADTIVDEVRKALSEAIISGELSIAKQYGPPYFMSDGHTAFIAENDRSINMDEDVVKNVIISKLNTRSVVKMNRHLNDKGLLKGKHTHKRKLKVAYDAGVLEDTEVFSYSKAVLNAEAKAYVDDIINNEYWFNVGEYPDGFVPILYNADGTRAAGYMFKPEMDDNFHEVYFGATRSGKTFALTNRAIQKVEVEGADAVLIFDQTGGFTPTEIDKHIGRELREKYFAFWNVYEDGLPVDLLDLRGCLTLKDERERILRIYAMMTKSLGSYQEPLLKIAVNCLLRQMKKTPDIKISDIINYIELISCNDDGEPKMDEAHKKLCLKLKTIIEDLMDMPVSKNNWGEFAKDQGKPIIVISTGADGVGKGSEIIDILLESLYGYKQCHPYEKYTVLIDEAQDLYLHEKGAVNVLLRKGGKHGVTMLLASQSFPDSTTPFGKVVGNCGRVRGYRSKGDDLARYADRFGCDKHEADSLQKGNCFDNGLFYSRYRKENVIKTLKGKTVVFEPAPDNDNNDGEQP